jgi:OFA family oxalate/formate antiporter-like MFS transporter
LFEAAGFDPGGLQEGKQVNRWFRLSAAVVAMIMIANLQYGWTLFTGPLTKATGWKLSEVQKAWTLFIALETWGMPFCGWLIDRRGPRLFMSIAGVLCGLGWAGLGQAKTLPALYALYTLAGIGAAMVYCGSIGVALKWFPDRRGTASGIIAAGFGSGSALFIPIMSHIIQVQDYRSAFLYTGIVQGLLIICAAQFLGGPGVAPPAAAKPAATIAARSHGTNFNSIEMLQTPHFYVLYASMLMMGVGGLMVTANASAVGKSLGIGSTAIATAISLNAVANGCGRFFWGWVSDRLGRERTMVIAFVLQSIFLTGVLTVGKLSGTLFIISLALVFFTWGEVYVLFPSATADYFGSKNASSNYGFMYSTKGVASIGGFVAALIFENTGSWSAVFYGSAVLALVSALLAFLLRKMPLPTRRAQASVATSGVTVK